MPPFASPQSRQAALETVVRQLPSTMARLAYVAGLRDPNSGTYSHALASGTSERAEASRVLKALHEEIFKTWLNYRLDEQQADLDLYFSSLDCSRGAVVETWLTLESYRCLIPASASVSERRLFVADLEALLAAMAHGSTSSAARLESSDSDERLLATQEVSRLLGVSPRTVRLWAESGDIPAVKVGRQWRFRPGDVRHWMERKKTMNRF